jgi:hypothetical protein
LLRAVSLDSVLRGVLPLGSGPLLMLLGPIFRVALGFLVHALAAHRDIADDVARSLLPAAEQAVEKTHVCPPLASSSGGLIPGKGKENAGTDKSEDPSAPAGMNLPGRLGFGQAGRDEICAGSGKIAL